MNPWIYVFIGGVFEMTWATTMGLSDGFTNIFWGAITLVINFVSVYFLNQGFKRGIPLGAGYAVWTGCGTLLSTASGWLILNESLSGLRVFFLAILLGGILLLQYCDGKEKEAA